jgi:CubicO group peptidase (beta-lactamase class C family)
MSARITLILATLASCLALASPASATPAVPTSVFDPNETGWLSYRNLTSSQFATKFAALKSDYMVIDLEVDVIDGAYRVGAVFRRNSDDRGWASLRNLTSAEFHERWTHYRDRGYRLVDQETYVHQGDRLYAGVWVENRESFGWASYRGVTSAQFSEEFDRYRDRGYLPIDFEVYAVGDELRYGAIWVENRESLAWKLKRNMTSAQFSTTFQTYADDGLRSLDFEAIETGNGMRYAGIWVENRSGRGWYLYRDLTATGYRNRWNQLYDKGYRLDNFEKYETGSGVRYSGIWRQNTSRPNWPLRAEVDALVQDERDDHDVPGIGVAIWHDGQTVYLGGVGHQDTEDGVWMHSGSVNRIASVSKAVTGTLAMRMIAEHPSIDLDDPIQDHLPQLPAHHTYTVGQALMNRSCLAHYPDGMSTQNQTHYDSSLEVLEEYMDEPLVCTPGEYEYSTFASNAPAAVFEGVEGKSFDEIALDELTVPFGLTTLRTENLAGSLPDRATLYETDNDEYAGDDTSNKWGGGGFVSSPRDLTRFGARILDGTILTEDQREEMWTPIGSYAIGWDVGSADSGERMVGKAGGQPGAKAYLRIYPDDGIVISVLSNRQGGGHSASALSESIGELMLDEL